MGESVNGILEGLRGRRSINEKALRGNVVSSEIRKVFIKSKKFEIKSCNVSGDSANIVINLKMSIWDDGIKKRAIDVVNGKKFKNFTGSLGKVSYKFSDIEYDKDTFSVHMKVLTGDEGVDAVDIPDAGDVAAAVFDGIVSFLD